MSKARLITLTSLAMIAFAGNSLLCRLALKHTGVDAASFTTIRLLSGAMMLWVAVRLSGGTRTGKGNWSSAWVLFVYAACFSFAYVSLPTAIGALLLFGAVQATMISYGVWAGERLLRLQLVGLTLAFGGACRSVAARSLGSTTVRIPIDGECWDCMGCLFFVWERCGRSHHGNGG